MENKPKNQGFTLVELAIAMVIIGLLIGGILKGQELINQSKITATASRIKAYTAAYHGFIEKYNAVPGDMLQARARLPNCTGGCVNGDGDGIVGVHTTSATYGATQAGTTSLPQVETTMFWRHLALADMITGVDTQASVTAPEYGFTHPSAPIGGGFDIFHWMGGVDIALGPNLRIQGGFRFSGSSTVVVSGDDARQLDTKIDDGHPDRGIVRADFSHTGCDVNGVYLNSDTANCVLYLSIR